MSAERDLSRLSLNTATTKRWTLREAVDGAVRAGLPAIGVWRDRVQEAGVGEAAKIIADAGLRVSSLCRGGFLTADDDAAATAALDDNRRAIVEAATLGTRELIMVVGGLPAASAPGGPALPGTAGRDIVGARQRVADRIGELAPFAAGHGVRLVLEPLHPIFAADRAVISTLGQALDIAEPYPADVVGVVVDTYHVWWDPDLQRQIARAGAAGPDRELPGVRLDPAAGGRRRCCPAGTWATGTSTSRRSRGGSPRPATPGTSRWRSSTSPSGTPRATRRSRRWRTATCGSSCRTSERSEDGPRSGPLASPAQPTRPEDDMDLNPLLPTSDDAAFAAVFVIVAAAHRRGHRRGRSSSRYGSGRCCATPVSTR